MCPRPAMLRYGIGVYSIPKLICARVQCCLQNSEAMQASL